MDIGKVFNPASIAIIGVSDKKGSYGGSAAKHAAQNSNADRVYYVLPPPLPTREIWPAAPSVTRLFFKNTA